LAAETNSNNNGEASAHPAVRHVVDQYCSDCHNPDDKKGELDLEAAVARADLTSDSKIWERVVRRLRARQMPPKGKDRPDENGYHAILAELEATLDRAAEQHPNPGRTDTFRRLNRTEYQNAIRDLLALDVDAAMLLPKDDGGHGFDNVTVGTPFTDVVGSLHFRGAKDQSARRRDAHARKVATPFAFAPMSRRRRISKDCRSGHAAGR
jgi:mono/diheme cytochrome c family protein